MKRFLLYMIVSLLVLAPAGCSYDGDDGHSRRDRDDYQEIKEKQETAKPSGDDRPNFKYAGKRRDTTFETLSEGEEIDVKNHIVKGAWTVVKFTADW